MRLSSLLPSAGLYLSQSPLLPSFVFEEEDAVPLLRENVEGRHFSGLLSRRTTVRGSGPFRWLVTHADAQKAFLPLST